MSWLQGGWVDLPVTDLDMPGWTGFDLMELARSLPRPPEVLVITAQKWILGDLKGKFRPDHCLLKPFELEDFRAKVAWLTRSWADAPSPKLPQR